MDESGRKPIPLPIQAVKDQFATVNARAARKVPRTLLETYSRKVASEEDWEIIAQPPMALPKEVADWISIILRDEFHQLVEETREINNRFAGKTFRYVYAVTLGDAELLNLRDRTLRWAENTTKELLFKTRYKAKENPLAAYFKAYTGFVQYVDQVIAFGGDRMYQLVWSAALDLIPYQLLDALLVKPRRVYVEIDDTDLHTARLSGNLMGSPAESEFLCSQLSLYGFEAVEYVNQVILPQLDRILAADITLPPDDLLQSHIDKYTGDILEVYPYLFSSSRFDRYTFNIPGNRCAGIFNFVAMRGFACFCFSDDMEALLKGMHLSYYRGMLDLQFNGQISFYMHPWMTLQRVYGAERARRMSYWLLKQVHHALVSDYLKINRYYLDAKTNTAGSSVVEIERETELSEEYRYIAWVQEAQTALTEFTDIDDVERELDDPPETIGAARLPQIRRSRFFKLLRECGVAVEQGKGSEIKLLRGATHPFRLGNHYGPNPTIPSFVAGNILKRLEITREEWMNAIQTMKLSRF